MSRKNEITKFQFIELRKLELMEGYIMIGFSIMMWFCSALLIFVSFSLLKGNSLETTRLFRDAEG